MKNKLYILILFGLSCNIPFCTVTFNPDGSRTYGVDTAQVIEVLEHK